jgi:hypothetical protein
MTLALGACKIKIDLRNTDGDPPYMISGHLYVNDALPGDPPIDGAIVYLQSVGRYVDVSTFTISGIYGLFDIEPGTYTLCAHYQSPYAEYQSEPFVVYSDISGMDITLYTGIIKLSQTETHIFRSLDPLEVTVNSIGDGSSGELKLSLSGAAPESFFISTDTLSSIPTGSSSTFLVTADGTKPTGFYVATVNVSGNNISPASFEVQFSIVGKD